MAETGPFGFSKYTYKYDIAFDDAEAAEKISFREYSLLLDAHDDGLCEVSVLMKPNEENVMKLCKKNMFYRMGRDYILDDPCADNKCRCKSLDTPIVTVNPLFQKLLWKESPVR